MLTCAAAGQARDRGGSRALGREASHLPGLEGSPPHSIAVFPHQQASLSHISVSSVQSVVKPSCILATNTSTLPIDRIAAAVGDKVGAQAPRSTAVL